MSTFRVALAQMNPTVGDLAGNTSKILEIMAQARQAGADLLAFPELTLTGYRTDGDDGQVQIRRADGRIVLHKDGN